MIIEKGGVAIKSALVSKSSIQSAISSDIAIEVVVPSCSFFIKIVSDITSVLGSTSLLNASAIGHVSQLPGSPSLISFSVIFIVVFICLSKCIFIHSLYVVIVLFSVKLFPRFFYDIYYI